MVLINIDTLSDAELRYIAQQEELEDWESLSREELIDELESIYDETDDVQSNQSGSSKRKFIKTLTDVDSDNVLKLPGVENLPDHYNETSIHLIMRDFNWAYAFWSLSAQQISELEESGASLILRTKRFNAEGEERAAYDIDITCNDSSWTIELPHMGYRYQAFLIAVKDGVQSVICQSNSISTTKSWFSQHPEVLCEDVTFRTMFSSLITKGGEVFGNRQVSELIDIITDNTKEDSGK